MPIAALKLSAHGVAAVRTDHVWSLKIVVVTIGELCNRKRLRHAANSHQPLGR